MSNPIHYIEPVFRPPSEWRSLILPVTNGCSWNKCTFCDMYTQPQKKFKAHPEAVVLEEIAKAAQTMQVERIFLADGDAMILPSHRLLTILEAINTHFPNIQRISAYCLPRNLKRKSVEELTAMKNLGLTMLYVGCESGDDKVLEAVNKGESYQSQMDALVKIKQAGIQASVMILNGLGGTERSRQHAEESARLVNDAQPEFVSTLIVSFPLGQARFNQAYQDVIGCDFVLPNQRQLFEELALFLQKTQLKNTVFRSDHASNYLPLKGRLGQDKDKLLAQLHTAIHAPNNIPLRQEWQRGL